MKSITNRLIKQIKQMQQQTTDIDRKLAIYYHPLFQQAITLLTDLFLKDSSDQDEQHRHGKQSQRHAKKQPKGVKDTSFSLGLMQFIQFNLKLQKCLLPTFQAQNAIISSLNDWVKQVAQCLNFDGMVITTQCQQITDSNFQHLLRTQIMSSKMQLYETTEKYIRTLARLKNHDAFKLLGVKVNKEVYSKFMFDLCSTWCEFLDIELFVYFLLAIYLHVSEGENIKDSKFKSTHMIQTIDLEFMEQFEEIKQNYSKSKKKQLRYYRSWCEWNYLRVGQVGEGLILCLDNILDDNRVLQIALVFQKAIKVINEQITSQSSQNQTPQDTIALKSKDNQQKDFLIMKKLETKDVKSSLNAPPTLQNPQKSIQTEKNNLQSSIQDLDKSGKNQKTKQKSIQREGTIRIHSRNQTISEDQLDGKRNQPNYIELNDQYNNNPTQVYQDELDMHHDFEIQIDELGNMYLKRIVKLPILGEKIQPLDFSKKKQMRTKWIEKKRKQCRQISNLYRRLENMKVRLQHNAKNDHYSYKKNPRIVQRDRFYEKSLQSNANTTQVQQKNVPAKDQTVFQKSIHQKLKPEFVEPSQPIESQESTKPLAKPEAYFNLLKPSSQIRSNPDYIHKVMAPSFLTDQKNNISYIQKQGNVYGVGAQEERRDIKLNLPKIKFLKDFKIKEDKSYHVVGKLTKDRTVINERIKSISFMQENTKKQLKSLGIPTEQDKIDKLKQEYHHIFTKYIDEQEISELTNFNDFYQKVQQYKERFSNQFQSQYRQNLKPIFLYENRRYEMGGIITRKQEQNFYQKMKKMINRDERRKKKKERKLRFRKYKNTFKNKKDRSFFQQVFINYHKNQIKQIKDQRSRIKSQIVQMSSTAH